MILMKGSERILEKPLEEQTGSTSQLKLLSIYGITSYTQLYNIPLEVRCSTGADVYINININSLGVKSLKYKGLTELPTNSILSGSTYRIMYNGTDFTLLDIAPTDNNSLSITYIPDAILSLTNSASSSDITTAFGSSTNLANFMEAIEDNIPIFLTSNSGGLTTVIKTIMSIETEGGITTEIDTIQVVIPSTKKLKTLSFIRVPDASTYTSVTVTEEDLGGHDYSTEIADLTSRVEALEQQIGPEPEPEPKEIQTYYEIEYD